MLVVDDSSPDGTGEVVAAIAAGRAAGPVAASGRPSPGLASAYLAGFQAAIDERVRPRRRDGLGSLPRPRGALDACSRSRPAPRPRRREPVHPGRVGDGLEPLPGRPVARRERLRAAHARLADPRCHERVPGVPPGPPGGAPARAVRTRTGTGSRSSWSGGRDRLGYDVGEAPITFRERDTARRRSPTRSWPRRCGRSRAGAGPCGSGPAGLPDQAAIDLNAHNARYVTLSSNRSLLRSARRAHPSLVATIA